MKIIAIIPARLAATRFPDKPLKKILGIPMIGHCYYRSTHCSILDEIYVATCDQEIIDYVEKIGGKAIMTSVKHERATERTAEALFNIEALFKNVTFDIVVMIQGDEPLVDPKMIHEVIQPLIDSSKMVSNLMVELKSHEDHINSNNVKVVTDLKGNALYMSREPIPSSKKFNGNLPMYRQLGMIAFKREALLNYISLDMSPLEIIESVDMNRFIENNIPIHMTITKYEADSVDTPLDLIRVEEKMITDTLFNSYKNLTS